MSASRHPRAVRGLREPQVVADRLERRHAVAGFDGRQRVGVMRVEARCGFVGLTSLDVVNRAASDDGRARVYQRVAVADRRDQDWIAQHDVDEDLVGVAARGVLDKRVGAGDT
jgi:hypothetical protein